MKKGVITQFFEPPCRHLPEAGQKEKQMGMGKDTVQNKCCSSIHQVLKLAPKSGDSIKPYGVLIILVYAEYNAGHCLKGAKREVDINFIHKEPAD